MDHAQKHIALVEDTPSLTTMYRAALQQEGYRVTCIGTGSEALDYLATQQPDLVLLDLKLPDMDGLQILKTLRKRQFGAPVIVITGHGSINTAIDAMRSGARDFLVKPFSVERLCTAVKSELEKDPMTTMPPELAGLTRQDSGISEQAASYIPAQKENFGGFIGTSPIMQKVYEQIEAAAKSSATVFITGESGTGKEVCAEAIHKHSMRADKPFIPINCAAIPRDLMESELFGHVKGAFTGAIAEREGAAKLANGGTLFLDEIAEMNPDMQTKLLRFLQNFTFQKVGGSKLEKTDARIICATNRNPVEEIHAGRFREDLFYRLHVLPLYMPPLRDRGDDLIDISHILLLRYAREENKAFECFAAETEDMLRRYEWPGNIRQLQNVIRNIVVMRNARIVTPDMLPPGLLHSAVVKPHYAQPRAETGTGTDPDAWEERQRLFAANGNRSAIRAGSQPHIRPLAEVERETIEEAISLCEGNIPQAAAALGLSPSTIYRKKAGWEN